MWEQESWNNEKSNPAFPRYYGQFGLSQGKESPFIFSKFNPLITGHMAPSVFACVASVSSRGSSRKLGQEQKKIYDGGGAEGNSPSPSPFNLFFASALTFAQ